jgi:FkbM family methyltransferase
MKYLSFLKVLPTAIANKVFAKIINIKNFTPSLSYFSDVSLKFGPKLRMNLHPSDIGHRYLAFTGVYEKTLSKTLTNIAKNQGGLMVDVGANYGYFTLLWAQFENNSAISIEASPRNYPKLKENIALNNLEHKINAHELALSNKVGSLRFDLGPEEQTGWGGLNHLSTAKNETISVNTTTLDDFVFQYEIKVINLLKIDTEGSDYLVLEGAKNLIKNKRIQHIFWEHNKGRMLELGVTEDCSLKTLTEAGYLIKQISENEYYASIYKI